MRPRTIIALGDCAVTIDFPNHDGPPTRDLIGCLERQLRVDNAPGIAGLVPALRTLTVHYDPLQLDFGAISDYLDLTLESLEISAPAPRAPVIIPVCYGGEFGPDLDMVANTHRTTAEQIVARHTAGEYVVAMLGFLPGFPYLDGLDLSLHTPRRAAPRTVVPTGSVGIGGASTGVYPCSSPGGWQLIGRTTEVLFDASRTPPALLQPGDQVRFVSIPADQWRPAR